MENSCANTKSNQNALLLVMFSLFFIICLVVSGLLNTCYLNNKELDLGQIQGLRVAFYALAFFLLAGNQKMMRVFAYISASVYIACVFFFEMSCSGNRIIESMTGEIIFAMLFFATSRIVEKTGFGTPDTKIPTLIVSGYFLLACLFDSGLSFPKLLLAVLQSVGFLGLVLLLRRAEGNESFPENKKSHILFGTFGLLLCFALIIYSVYTFGFLKPLIPGNIESMGMARYEFRALTVYLLLAFSALGYILALFRRKKGLIVAVLSSSVLFLLLFFVWIAPVTNMAKEVTPFLSRMIIGVIAVAYPTALLFCKKKQ